MDRIKDMASGAGSIQEYLSGVNFPASKDELIAQLEQNGAPEQILDRVRGVSSDHFESAQDAIAKIQGMV